MTRYLASHDPLQKCDGMANVHYEVLIRHSRIYDAKQTDATNLSVHSLHRETFLRHTCCTARCFFTKLTAGFPRIVQHVDTHDTTRYLQAHPIINVALDAFFPSISNRLCSRIHLPHNRRNSLGTCASRHPCMAPSHRKYVSTSFTNRTNICISYVYML